MIVVIATVHVRSEHRADFLENARALIGASLKEAGCQSYDLHSSITEPNCFVFVERWASREALAAHDETAHLKEWRRVADPFVETTTMEVITPAAVDAS